MSDNNISRTLSTVSTDSTASLNSEDFEETPADYNEAPWDIYGDAEGVGRVLVARKGDSLPCNTKYKVRKGSSVAASFR